MIADIAMRWTSCRCHTRIATPISVTTTICRLAAFGRGNGRGAADGNKAERAKERMRLGGGDKRSGVQQIAPPIENTGKARDKAAKAVGVNRQYVSDAKKIEKETADLADAAPRWHRALRLR
jgi:hypothetical protein